jgi:hypothetical protein
MKSRHAFRILFGLSTAGAVWMLWSGHQHLQQQQQQQQHQHTILVSRPKLLAPSPPWTSSASASVPNKHNWTALSRIETARRKRGKHKHPYVNYEPYPKDGRPCIDDILDAQGNIIGDPQKLLDVAIIGFGKAGTTTVMNWLSQHGRIHMYPQEIYDLADHRPAHFIQKLYMLPVGENLIRGYKSPMDLTMHHVVQDYLRRYWPATNLVVGIRHPVRWFESLYNFRIQNLQAGFNVSTFPEPGHCIGPCTEHSMNTCTIKGEFALFLRNLGKTLLPPTDTGGAPITAPVTATDPVTADVDDNGNATRFEKTMYRVAKMGIPIGLQYMPNPVFLFDVQQLADTNQTRAAAFRYDLSRFVGLQPPDQTDPDQPTNESSYLLSKEIPHSKPGKARSPARQLELDAHKMDICQPAHLLLRRDLMRMARASSLWIRRYFVPLQQLQRNITISSPDYFVRIMEDWMHDPCGDNATATAGARMVDAFDKDQQARLQHQTATTATVVNTQPQRQGK